MSRYTQVFASSFLVIHFATSLTLAQGDWPAYRPIQGQAANDGEVWKNIRADGVVVALREIALVAAPEVRPALSVRLMPDEFDAKTGNAALFICKR